MTKRTLTQIKRAEPTKMKGSWTYSKLQIDLDKLKQLRVAIYDNEPTAKHSAVNGRYRAELQLWTDTDITQTRGDYKLVNKLSNWSTFRLNQYKKEDDVNAVWYQEVCAKIKDLTQELSTADTTVVACPLGARQNNADGQQGYAHVPKMILAYITNGDTHIARLFLDDIDPFDIDILQETPVASGNDGREAICRYERMEVACG